MRRIFSNGANYRAWRSNNCSKCKKDYDWENYRDDGMNPKCWAEEALSMASIGCREELEAVALFMGWQKERAVCPCPHLEPIEVRIKE